MSKESNSFQVIRPFGPWIAKVTIPEETIKILNDYVDNIIKDNKKSKELDFGDQLAGNVQQAVSYTHLTLPTICSV